MALGSNGDTANGVNNIVPIRKGDTPKSITVVIPLSSVTDTWGSLTTLEAAVTLAFEVLKRAGKYSETEVLRGVHQVLNVVNQPSTSQSEQKKELLTDPC